MRKRRVWIPLVLCLVIVIAAVSLVLWHHKHGSTKLPPQYYTQRSSDTKQVPKLDHVVIIVEENHGFNKIIGNPDASYINELATKYALAENYFATAHPSLPNYLDLTSGTNGTINNDCNPPGAGCELSVANIADRIEKAGKTWKSYQESMPAPCQASNSGSYATKHNPFVYYTDILHDKQRCESHVVPFGQLALDISSDALPDYAFITPNMCNDTHDCPVKTGDQWLADTIPKILDSKQFSLSNSLLVITWDEAEGAGSNKVATILAGSAVKKAYKSSQYYSHYSLLRTVEAAWGLAPLTDQDKNAPLMGEFFE